MSADGTLWREVFPALADADPETRNLLDAAHAVRMNAEQPVFRGGSPCANYVLLLQGSVRVQVIGEGGREVVLYRVLPGQSCVLTTCCILSGDAYPAEGFTEADVRALAITKPTFDRALETAPAFRRFVFANLGERIADIILRMEEITFRPVERRIAAYLLAGAHGDGTLHATHQEIAVEVGSAREVVSRHLKRMESGGLVGLGRSSVRVTDREGLQRLLQMPM